MAIFTLNNQIMENKTNKIFWGVIVLMFLTSILMTPICKKLDVGRYGDYTIEVDGGIWHSTEKPQHRNDRIYFKIKDGSTISLMGKEIKYWKK